MSDRNIKRAAITAELNDLASDARLTRAMAMLSTRPGREHAFAILKTLDGKDRAAFALEHLIKPEILGGEYFVHGLLAVTEEIPVQDRQNFIVDVLQTPRLRSVALEWHAGNLQMYLNDVFAHVPAQRHTLWDRIINLDVIKTYATYRPVHALDHANLAIEKLHPSARLGMIKTFFASEFFKNARTSPMWEGGHGKFDYMPMARRFIERLTRALSAADQVGFKAFLQSNSDFIEFAAMVPKFSGPARRPAAA